jgi:hypothetical protein
LGVVTLLKRIRDRPDENARSCEGGNPAWMSWSSMIT